MNKNANSADVRYLTRATLKAGKSLILKGRKSFGCNSIALRLIGYSFSNMQCHCLHFVGKKVQVIFATEIKHAFLSGTFFARFTSLIGQ